ncbi:LPXTG cell wall anchor domain-containing protein [Lactococcus lactis]|uniref:LPXTG cell wall anchor domain-containing protein n=1 Tax=Lactococcus lactis TaxID=1358 RepID=UPI001C54CBFA|nr:LPXTG cell wall anchor domain-containing protein [Lactococcus lactis]
MLKVKFHHIMEKILTVLSQNCQSTGEQKSNLFLGSGSMLIGLAVALYGGLKKWTTTK